jgi:hypothetical protein
MDLLINYTPEFHTFSLHSTIFSYEVEKLLAHQKKIRYVIKHSFLALQFELRALCLLDNTLPLELFPVFLL